jgi:hypothetical protein
MNLTMGLNNVCCLSRNTHASVTSAQTGAKKFLEARREMKEHTLTSCEKWRTNEINQTCLSV